MESLPGSAAFILCIKKTQSVKHRCRQTCDSIATEQNKHKRLDPENASAKLTIPAFFCGQKRLSLEYWQPLPPLYVSQKETLTPQ